MPNRSVTVELRAMVSSYVAGMKQAQVATTEFASKAQKQIQASKDQINDLSNKSAIAGGVLIAGVAAIGKTYADFDRQMSAVAATGDDAKGSLEGLRESALRLGKDTAFSATEAAQGVENLLKAGVKASDVIGGALAGALSLAAAGEVSVADAAETAAMAMTQFHLKGTDVSHVADLLAAGAGKAQGEVSDLSMALRQSGLVASQFGINIEDTVGTLSAFANAGLIGSDAGTSFKAMLLQLAGPSGTSAKLMEKLGISAYDAAGKFIGITGLAEQLQSRLGSLTQAQRNQAMAQIFGNDAIRSANVLYELGADGLQKIIDQTDDAGYAAEVAATRLDNLSGDWEKFTGSVETAALRSGSGLNTFLRGLTQSATGAVDAVSELPAPVLESTVRIAALAGGALLAVGAFGKLTVGLSDALGSFDALKTRAPKTATALGVVGKAAGVAAAAFAVIEISAVFGRQQQDAIDGTYASLSEVAAVLAGIGNNGGSLAQLDEQFGRVQTKMLAWQTGEQAVSGVGEAIKRVSDASRLFFGGDDSQVSRMVASWFGTKTAVVELEDQIKKVDQALASMDSTQAAEAFAEIRKQAEASGAGLEDLIGQFPEYKATLESVVAELGVANPSLEEYADWMGGKVPQAVQDATAAHPELVDKMSAVQKEAAGGAQSLKDYAASVWAAADAVLETSGSQAGFERTLDDTASAVDKLNEKAKKAGHFKDLTNVDTKWGRDAIDQLNKIATSTETYTNSLIKNGGTQDEARLAVARARKEFIDEATSMGYSTKKAEELADARGLIPENINLETTEEGTQAAAERLKDLKAAIKGLPKSAQTEVLSEFKDNGIDAAYTALAKIDGKAADAWVKSMLDNGGISDWKKYKPDDKNAHINVLIRTGKLSADGNIYGPGLVHQFASGGFGQPQVRPFQGDAGVNWGEAGSGPWEAFISGAPQKRDRSLAIWREVGRRLLGSFSASDVLQGFADGGIAEPTWGGQTLSYWSQQLKTPLELTQLQIQIRDLKADLKATETYNPPGKKKKATRLKLRDLDRTEAEQRLAEAEAELALSAQAQQLNSSLAGTIDAQIAAWQAADQKSRDDWQKAQNDDAEADRVAEQAASASASNAQKWVQQYMQGSSFDDLVANMAAGASALVDFQNGLSRLQNQGLNRTVLDFLASTGSESLLNDVISRGKAGVDALNGLTDNLSAAAGALGQSQVSGAYAAAPVLTNVDLPSYMTSGAVGSTVSSSSRTVQFYVTSDDPYAAATVINQQLRTL